MSPKANASQSLAGNSIETKNYNSMKSSELRECCGRKHGRKHDTPIKAQHKVKGRWINKSKQELLLEFKNFIQSKSALKTMFCKQLSEQNANPATSMISTVTTPTIGQKPVWSEPLSVSDMALDGKRNLHWHWSLTASGVSLVGWNGQLTEEQIDSWKFFVAQGITVSRETFAESDNQIRKLMKKMNARKTKLRNRKVALTKCGPFAKRHFEFLKAKNTVAHISTSSWEVFRWHG